MSWLDNDPSKSGLPWMVRAKEDEWIGFSIKLDSIEESTSSPPSDDKKKWTCYIGKMKEIEMDDIEDGDHEIPFWAMAPFWTFVTDSGEKKGWMAVEFRRSKKGQNNEASFRASD